MIEDRLEAEYLRASLRAMLLDAGSLIEQRARLELIVGMAARRLEVLGDAGTAAALRRLAGEVRMFRATVDQAQFPAQERLH